MAIPGRLGGFKPTTTTTIKLPNPFDPNKPGPTTTLVDTYSNVRLSAPKAAPKGAGSKFDTSHSCWDPNIGKDILSKPTTVLVDRDNPDLPRGAIH